MEQGAKREWVIGGDEETKGLRFKNGYWLPGSLLRFNFREQSWVLPARLNDSSSSVGVVC